MGGERGAARGGEAPGGRRGFRDCTRRCEAMPAWIIRHLELIGEVRGQDAIIVDDIIYDMTPHVRNSTRR